MAEYTIPQKYRDFYVTDPLIELKNNLQATTDTLQTHISDLQNTILNGYVSTDLFEGAANQVITFNDEKHGFSVTNLAGRAASWKTQLANVDKWAQGNINSSGIPEVSSNRVYLKEFIPVMPGATYQLNQTDINTSYEYFLTEYDTDKLFVGESSWITLPYAPTLNSLTKYIRVTLRKNDENISPESVFEVITDLNLSVTAYTTPDNITTNVSSCASIPFISEAWESGSLDVTTGKQSENSNHFIVRTKEYINFKGGAESYLSILTDEYIPNVRIYQYTKDGEFISAITDLFNDYIFTLDEHTAKIKIVIIGNPELGLSPFTLIETLKRFIIYNEKMTIGENDTRIVTMPSFTSLYIQSNVPYQGYVLDLSE